MIIIDLIHNLALLVALGLVSALVGQWTNRRSLQGLAQGALFGAVAIVGMMSPVVLSEGIFFDGRSVVVSICGLFFGPLAVTVTSAMAIALRFTQGGAGALTGVLVVLAAASIGLMFHARRRNNPHTRSMGELFVMGVSVHLVMLALMFTLPGEAPNIVLAEIALPVMLTYPIATVLLGSVLAEREKRNAAMDALSRAGESLRGTEEVFRQSEARFRTLVESAPDAIFVVVGESFAYVNDASVRLLGGASPSDLVGRPVRDRFDPASRDALVAALNILNAEKASMASNDEVIVRLDGAPIDVEVSAVPFVYEGEDGALVFARDAAKRKRAERAYEQTAALLRMAGKTARLGGWTMDTSSGRVVWSDEVCDIHGVPHGTSPTVQEGVAFYTPQCRERLRAAIAKCASSGTPFDLEADIVTANGRHVCVRVIGHAERDASGKIERVQGAFQDLTQIKDVENSLAKSQERFRQLAEAMPLIVWTADPDGVVDYASHALAVYAGVDFDENPGATWIETVHPDDVETCITVWEHSARTGEIYENEFRMRRASDGAYRWHLVQAVPIRDDDGGISKWYGTATDIDDSKRTAEELQRLADRFKKTLDSITDAFYTLDREWRFTYLNKEAERLLLRSSEDLLGKVASTEYEIEPGSVVSRMYRKAAREQCTVEFEEYVETIGKWLEVRVYPSDEGLAVYFRDVSERRLAEQTLRETTARLQGILDYSPLLIIEIDQEGNCLQLNRAACQLLDVEGHEIQGKNLSEFVYPGDFADIMAHVAEVVQGRTPITVEDRFMVGDEERYFSTAMFPLFDNAHQIASIAGITKDITDTVRARQERERLEGQLRQAQKMEAVGRLAGGIAHDFNNMLSVILGRAGLVAEQLDKDSPVQKDVKEILAAGERSAELTKQLLAFARKQTIAPKVLNFNDAVGTQLNMFRRLIGEEIQLVWKPAQSLWRVNMDPVQIDQILANLVVNSRDAINGVGKITIETSQATLDREYCASHAGAVQGEFALLTVSDTGSGMDKETQAQLFEPFFTTKEIGKGTGLGLATVYGIVKQNGGFITVYSELGRGTTFKIYIPRHTGESETEPPPAETTPRHLGAGTILLVEDETALLNLGRQILEAMGYTVLATSSPKEALRWAAELDQPIDLLMSDVIMPEMSGHDVWRHISALRPAIKCLFVSGYTADVIADRGILDEGVEFLEKPYTTEALAEKLRTMLQSG